MDRRSVLQSLLALGAAPWGGTSRAEAPDLTLIHINIPDPHILPFLAVELIPLLGIDQALGAHLAIRYPESNRRQLPAGRSVRQAHSAGSSGNLAGRQRSKNRAGVRSARCRQRDDTMTCMHAV